MTYSISGLAYLIFSFAIGFLTYRVFQYWKKEKDTSSKIWFFVSFLFLMFGLIKAIGGLFFANNSNFLIGTIIGGAFLQTFIFAILGYFIFYIKFPQSSPWLGFVPLLVFGLISAILTILYPYTPFLEPSGAINWGFPPKIIGILRICLFLIAFIPTIIIFFQQFKAAENAYIKTKTFGFILIFIFAIVASLLDFLIISIFKLDAVWRDLSMIIISGILSIILVLTRRPMSPYEEN